MVRKTNRKINKRPWEEEREERIAAKYECLLVEGVRCFSVAMALAERRVDCVKSYRKSELAAIMMECEDECCRPVTDMYERSWYQAQVHEYEHSRMLQRDNDSERKEGETKKEEKAAAYEDKRKEDTPQETPSEAKKDSPLEAKEDNPSSPSTSQILESKKRPRRKPEEGNKANPVEAEKAKKEKEQVESESSDKDAEKKRYRYHESPRIRTPWEDRYHESPVVLVKCRGCDVRSRCTCRPI